MSHNNLLHTVSLAFVDIVHDRLVEDEVAGACKKSLWTRYRPGEVVYTGRQSEYTGTTGTQKCNVTNVRHSDGTMGLNLGLTLQHVLRLELRVLESRAQVNPPDGIPESTDAACGSSRVRNGAVSSRACSSAGACASP